MSDLKFIPITEYKLPKGYPYTIHLIHTDGTRSQVEINSANDEWQLKLETVVALAFELHDSEGFRLAREFWNTRSGSVLPRNSVLITFYNWLVENRKLPSAEPKAKTWLYDKITSFNFRIPSGGFRDIHNWFNDPETYPEVPFDIRNAILTTKPSGGGKVVVLPTGHTIAYTYARNIYRTLCGFESYQYSAYQGKHNQVSIREYLGGHRWSSNRNKPWNMRDGTFIIGCQRIPVSAIQDLADREGWNGEILPKYL